MHLVQTGYIRKHGVMIGYSTFLKRKEESRPPRGGRIRGRTRRQPRTRPSRKSRAPGHVDLSAGGRAGARGFGIEEGRAKHIFSPEQYYGHGAYAAQPIGMPYAFSSDGGAGRGPRRHLGARVKLTHIFEHFIRDSS